MKNHFSQNIIEWINENKSLICSSNVNKTKKQIKNLFDINATAKEIFDIVKKEDIIDCQYSEFVSFSVGYKSCKKNCKCYKERLSKKVKDSRNNRSLEQKKLEREKRIKTVKERYGTDNVFQNKNVKQKIKKTMKDKYGEENPMKVDAIKTKAKSTVKEKYGVVNVMQNTSICEKNHKDRDYKKYTQKVKDTKKQKYGCENFNNSQQAKQTNIEKYGVYNPSKNLDIRKKISKGLKSNFITRHQQKYNIDFVSFDYKPLQYNKVLCKVCENEYDAKIFNGNITKCPTCYPEKCSDFEFQVKEYIKSILPPSIHIEMHDRKILDGKEIDIFIPDLSLGFECNGIYWHTEDSGKDRNYHYSKTKNAHGKNITLVHIFSDEWELKNEIIKSRIKNLLGQTSCKIYAKVCEIKHLKTKEAKIFLNENHLDGYGSSSVKIGLYHENNLVSVMTFAKNRFSKKANNKDYEMIRYASLQNHVVVGAASKLFKYFLNLHAPETVVTFSNNAWGLTDFYKNLGFIRDSYGTPGYFYVDRYKPDGRINRLNMQKHKLIEQGAPKNLTETQITESIGLSKVWDCGHTKWIWKK